MPRVLPLAPFINKRALADEATLENILPLLQGQLSPPPRPGPYPPHQPARNPLYPGVQKLSPSEVIAPPVTIGAPQIGGALQSLPGLLGAPLQGGQPQFPMQDMGDLPEGPTYPHVQPGDVTQPGYAAQGPQVQPHQPAQQPVQQAPQFGIQPRTDQGFGDGAGAQAQQPQQGMSNAGMWGLLAAGLGILANNYGNYGQASPAIGKGGLIGLNTFLDQRQVGIENVRRDELAKAAAAQQEALARYRDQSIGLQGRQVTMAEEKAAREQQQQDVKSALALALAGQDPKMQKLALADSDAFLKFSIGQMKPDYKERSIKQGKEAYDEYSIDGGKTWDKVPGGSSYDLRAAKGGSDIAMKVEQKQSEAFTKPIADSVDVSFKQAQSSIAAQTTLNSIRDNLDNPELIAGIAANKRLTLERIKQFFGGGSEEGLAKTRAVIQGLSELTLQSRSMLQGQGQITEKEQALLERARGGDIEFSVPELKELVDVLSRMQRAQYDAHGDTLRRLEGVPGGGTAGKFFVPPPFPEYSPKTKSEPWKRDWK